MRPESSPEWLDVDRGISELLAGMPALKAALRRVQAARVCGEATRHQLVEVADRVAELALGLHWVAAQRTPEPVPPSPQARQAAALAVEATRQAQDRPLAMEVSPDELVAHLARLRARVAQWGPRTERADG